MKTRSWRWKTLKYYLIKVNLHFAEVMFTEDQTYNSLGRRIFDVYIQVNYLKLL